MLGLVQEPAGPPGSAEPGQPTAARPRQPQVRAYLFADVRGYTALTGTSGPHVAAPLVRRFVDVATAAVEANGGEVVERAGDEILAEFSSARAAVRSAVDLAVGCADATLADP